MRPFKRRSAPVWQHKMGRRCLAVSTINWAPNADPAGGRRSSDGPWTVSARIWDLIVEFEPGLGSGRGHYRTQLAQDVLSKGRYVLLGDAAPT